MKGKRIIAVLLVAIMAFTVVSTAGVLTAPKATAATTPTYLPVTYVEGKTYTFSSSQCNIHDTASMILAGKPLLIPVSQGNTATALVVTNTQSAGYTFASVGYLLGLTGYTADDLDKPCRMTMTLRGTVALHGGPRAYGSVWNPATSWEGVTVHSRDPVLAKTEIRTWTFTNTVRTVFWDTSTIPGEHLASAQAWALSQNSQAGQSVIISTAQISSVSITF
jgi:hypothetical protein